MLYVFLTILSRRPFARPFPLHEAEAYVGGKRPRGSRERALVHVQCEPKDNDEVEHQQLPSNFALSFEERLAQPRLRASKSRDLSKSKLAKETVANLRPAWCSSDGRPAILLVRGACRASGLSAVFASSKVNARGLRQSAKAYAQGNF